LDLYPFFFQIDVVRMLVTFISSYPKDSFKRLVGLMAKNEGMASCGEAEFEGPLGVRFGRDFMVSFYNNTYVRNGFFVIGQYFSFDQELLLRDGYVSINYLTYCVHHYQ